MTYFPSALRTVSVVTRWSVIRTHGKDTIADHSYRVAMYADEIARLIKWKVDDYKAHYWLMRYALIHDLDEIFTGDIVILVKSEIIDKDRAAHFVASRMQKYMPGIAGQFAEIASLSYADDIKKIIKAADWLDSLLFIIGEQHMGNTAIERYEAYSLDNLKEAWLCLPCQPGQLAELWLSEIQKAIHSHYDWNS